MAVLPQIKSTEANTILSGNYYLYYIIPLFLYNFNLAGEIPISCTGQFIQR
jgi:hypothetical protein